VIAGGRSHLQAVYRLHILRPAVHDLCPQKVTRCVYPKPPELFQVSTHGELS
jgi:hypothetical protein